VVAGPGGGRDDEGAVDQTHADKAASVVASLSSGEPQATAIKEIAGVEKSDTSALNNNNHQPSTKAPSTSAASSGKGKAKSAYPTASASHPVHVVSLTRRRVSRNHLLPPLGAAGGGVNSGEARKVSHHRSSISGSRKVSSGAAAPALL